jgi:hypothetical protein
MGVAGSTEEPPACASEEGCRQQRREKLSNYAEDDGEPPRKRRLVESRVSPQRESSSEVEEDEAAHSGDEVALTTTTTSLLPPRKRRFANRSESIGLPLAPMVVVTSKRWGDVEREEWVRIHDEDESDEESEEEDMAHNKEDAKGYGGEKLPVIPSSLPQNRERASEKALASSRSPVRVQGIHEDLPTLPLTAQPRNKVERTGKAVCLTASPSLAQSRARSSTRRPLGFSNECVSVGQGKRGLVPDDSGDERMLDGTDSTALFQNTRSTPSKSRRQAEIAGPLPLPSPPQAISSPHVRPPPTGLVKDPLALPISAPSSPEEGQPTDASPNVSASYPKTPVRPHVIPQASLAGVAHTSTQGDESDEDSLLYEPIPGNPLLIGSSALTPECLVKKRASRPTDFPGPKPPPPFLTDLTCPPPANPCQICHAPHLSAHYAYGPCEHQACRWCFYSAWEISQIRDAGLETNLIGYAKVFCGVCTVHVEEVVTLRDGERWSIAGEVVRPKVAMGSAGRKRHRWNPYGDPEPTGNYTRRNGQG